MQHILHPTREEWAVLTRRPVKNAFELEVLVKKIFEDIRSMGDKAVIKFAKRYEKGMARELRIDPASLSGVEKTLTPELTSAIRLAYHNILLFHEAQLETPSAIEPMPGVVCWRETRPIEKVGIYIPGGSAPLFSTILMLGIPAKIAGCSEIVLCTPPDENGEINPAILFTAGLVGITSIFAVGGIQAIGALTFGTESIPKVDKIFGPGNQYVTAAKQMAQHYGVAIDMPAGPSEVLIIADATCNPDFVAADLLSQAEHGEDSQVVLLTNRPEVLDAVLNAIHFQLEDLPRRAITRKALENSRGICLASLEECIEFSNLYAPEHLILAMEKPERLIEGIENAGSVFLGNYSCESAGDYASGTNHTLPTNGFARSYSGVSLDSFVKKITFQKLSADGIRNIGPAIEQMAAAEQLEAHKRAVSIRLAALASPSNPFSPA